VIFFSQSRAKAERSEAGVEGHRGISVSLLLLDLLASALVIAQAIGRWGNYFNSELYGRPSDLPWAIPIAWQNRMAGFENFTHFHPTFLYESLWCLFIFIFLFWRIKKIKPGLIFLLYLFLYSLGRFLIEFLRIDYQPVWFGLRLGHWTSLILIILSIVFYFILKKWYNKSQKVQKQ
jgi:phosphatidylglycerol:prolipoprotein diacylglycerol transferase